jgi:hypothetical protein
MGEGEQNVEVLATRMPVTATATATTGTESGCGLSRLTAVHPERRYGESLDR